jgi:hypothetical protein
MRYRPVIILGVVLILCGVVLGLGWYISTSQSMTGDLNSLDDSYVPMVPISTPPVTYAQFERLLQIHPTSYDKVCSILGSSGIEVTKEARARWGKRVFIWKNSNNSFVLVELWRDGTVIGMMKVMRETS